jgi:hypothetical protein
MLASGFLNSRYFNASDFADQPSNWTIASVNSEIIGRDDPAEKVVLELYDASGALADRRLVLNKTNVRALAKAFGDDMDAWIGRPIRINSIWVNYRGEQTRGIHVMPGAVAMRVAGGRRRRVTHPQGRSRRCGSVLNGRLQCDGASPGA